MNATIGALGVDRLSELGRLCEATGNDPRPLAIRTTDDEIDLSAQHVALSSNSLRNSLPEMPFRSSGNHDMTTQDLAEVLGLSRTFVVHLIDEGKLTAHFAGSHRRVRAADALAYARHRQARLDGVAVIAAADIAVGAPYHCTHSGEDRS